MGTGLVYHSTAIVEAAKSLVLSNVWQGTVPETSAKVYGACCPSAQRHLHVYCNVLVQCAIATQRERGIVQLGRYQWSIIIHE